MKNRFGSIIFGAIGLIVSITLMTITYLNMVIIFGTPGSEGQGDNYDAQLGDVEMLLFPALSVVLSLFLLFYPWLKLFMSMILGHSRKDYFGLFVAKGKVMRFVSGFLSVVNTASIIFAQYDTKMEACRIWEWDYSHALCPSNSLLYVGFILFIILFWGFVHLTYGFIHYSYKHKCVV